jgi:hypothetical protein
VGNSGEGVYENGRRPASVGPTDGDDGCGCWKAGRKSRNSKPLDKDSRFVALSRAMMVGKRQRCARTRLFLSASKSWRTSVVRVLPIPLSDVLGDGFRCNARLQFPRCGAGFAAGLLLAACTAKMRTSASKNRRRQLGASGLGAKRIKLVSRPLWLRSLHCKCTTV